MPGPPNAAPVRFADVMHGARGRFLIALLIAEFAAAMQGIAHSTVLPVVARDLDGFALFGAALAAGPLAALLMLSFAAPVLHRVRPLNMLLIATALYVLGASMAVFATTMAWVLAGIVVRGLAAGLFGGFGLGAIGTLFDERERPRVFGLFAMIWLLPSVLGPPLNAVVTEWMDWRWALAWPAILVLMARLLMGATIAAVPWRPDRGRPPVSAGVGVAVTGCLALGSVGSAGAGGWALAAYLAGVVGAAVAIGAFLVRGMRGSRAGARVLLTFALLCAAFFGSYELLSLTIIEALGSTVLVASVAVTGGLLGWSIVGLRPHSDARPDRVVVGAALVCASFGLLIGGLGLGGPQGIGCVIGGSTVCGIGMGFAYPLLSSEPFEHGAAASTVGTLIAFAEIAATAWGSLLAGGGYSALHARGWSPTDSLVVVFIALASLGCATVVSARRRHVGNRP
ncbi:MFS transporter [Micropruina sp.]|uniref:MFS transporter n=1 Tax=Micropruina sp. TaxID=2737536 RepID=UPI0039E54EBA